MEIKTDILTPDHANALSLQKDFHWFQQVLERRMKSYLQQTEPAFSINDIPPPDISADESPYARIVEHYKMGVMERLLLLLALSPHVCPQLLDVFYTKNELYARGFSEFGGLKGNYHSGFLPTGETASFLLAGTNLSLRFRLLGMFDPDHYFSRDNLLKLEKEKSNEPSLSGQLVLGSEYLSYMTQGTPYKPSFSAEFPAKRINTNLDWEDLILDNAIMEDVFEIIHWIEHHQTVLFKWEFIRMIKPGYRSLFYGPPGTGKTLTASLLGKTTGLDVYRVDLSKIVSKYIGETEKNMANIFDQAENKRWILFFDEADALFGKRTQTSDSKDRHANQEVAYLLQRVEDFPGVVILATNLRSNMDEAFARRFQSMIYFPMPGPKQRLKLWQAAFRQPLDLDPDINLETIAEKYEMAGGAIVNVLNFCALNAAKRGETKVYLYDILEGIRKEFRKEGKTV